MRLRCPKCALELEREPGRYVCPRGHSFDIARQGYVNLLSVEQKHSRSPGDTRQQVAARRAFLESGFYAPISQTLNQVAAGLSPTGEILDVGCGEGYYAARLGDALGLPLTGVDISKEAVRAAAGRYKGQQWLCATAAHLPVMDGSAGLVTSLFAVTLPGEFHRALHAGGYFLQVLTQPDHLLGLRSIIYDRLTDKHKDLTPQLPGFCHLDCVPIRFTFTVEGEQVQNLLAMTPHVYRIGAAGAQRLENTPRLTDTASCVLNVYRRV